MDQHLKTQQHQLDLAAFERHERMLRAAYKRATTPERSTDEPGGRNSSYNRRGIRGHRFESSPRFSENQSVE